MRLLQHSILVVFLLAGISATSQNTNLNFYSNRPALSWEEYLVSGNGIMGMMVAGNPYNEVQVYNHTELFLPIHEPLTPPSQGNHLAHIRRLMFEGKYAEASEFLVTLSHADGFGRKKQSDLFVPAFQLNMRSDSLRTSQYRRSVDFQSGEVVVTWKNRRGSFERRSFVSRIDRVAVTEIAGNKPFDLELNIELIKRFDPKLLGKFSLNDKLNIERMEQQVTPDRIAARVWYSTPWQGGYEGYVGEIRILREGGSAYTEGERVIIRGAKRLLLLCEVEPVKQINDTAAAEITDHLASLSDDYTTLLGPHRAYQSELMQRVSLTLGPKRDEQARSSEELLTLGGNHPALIERLFNAARYNIISATGVNPPNLQGIWSATMTPRWAGDYTTNGNLPTAVSHYLAASTPELMLSLFNKLESQMDAYRTNARILFRCRGIHIPSHICLHGYDNQFDSTWPMTFWTAGAAWYSMFYYDYYLYTGDEQFLRNRALPFMLEAAAFYEDFLIEGEDGKLVFNPSYSPENHPTNSPKQACINATMDIAVAKALFRDLIEVCSERNLHSDKLPLWRDILSKLPAYQLNEQGELREWCWQDLADNHEHRHASHLIGLYYRHDPEIMADEALKEGVRRAIDRRIAYRQSSTKSGEMAFGVSQLAFPACALGEGEVAYELLTMAGDNYFNNNLMTTHDPHTIFNTDMSGAYPAIILSMLTYSDRGLVSLLPACPLEWTEGELCGASLRGGIRLNRLCWNQSGVSATLTSSTDQTVKLYLRGKACGALTLKANTPYEVQLSE